MPFQEEPGHLAQGIRAGGISAQTVEPEAITAPTPWIDSADDRISARDVDYPRHAARRMKDARFRLTPGRAETRGHGAHTNARLRKQDLADLLQRTE